MHLPHKFERFRSPNTGQMWVIGAGLSYGVVPLPDEIVEKELAGAEQFLGIAPIENVPEGAAGLYFWAEKALEALQAQDSPIPAKLRLAQSLGILSDSRWFEKLELIASSPKHRVIARFAMDQKLDEIWSLNWDCHLENAMESIGFVFNEERQGVPWLTAYNTIVTNEDFEAARINNRFFSVLKPHGCVRALQQAEKEVETESMELAARQAERFMITEQELHAKRNGSLDNRFDARIRNSVQEKFLVAIGWSISEGNWLDILNQGNALRNGVSEIGDLSIIDPFFSEGHSKAAQVFDLTQANAHFEISTKQHEVDADTFFLWLQAHYCFDQMRTAADNLQAHEAVAELTAVSDELDTIAVESFLYDWTDQFLPEWNRLCWRGGTITGAAISPDRMDHHNKHEHIPLNVHVVERPDLLHAALLLGAIRHSGHAYDVKRFPGSLFRSELGELIVPIPAWNNSFNALAALKPMLCQYDAMGLVATVNLLPLAEAGTPLSVSQQDTLKQQFCYSTAHPNFADPRNVNFDPALSALLGITYD